VSDFAIIIPHSHEFVAIIVQNIHCRSKATNLNNWVSHFWTEYFYSLE